MQDARGKINLVSSLKAGKGCASFSLFSGSNLHGGKVSSSMERFDFSTWVECWPHSSPLWRLCSYPKTEATQERLVPAWFATSLWVGWFVSVSAVSSHISLLPKNVSQSDCSVFKQLLENHNPSEKAKSWQHGPHPRACAVDPGTIPKRRRRFSGALTATWEWMYGLSKRLFCRTSIYLREYKNPCLFVKQQT